MVLKSLIATVSNVGPTEYYPTALDDVEFVQLRPNILALHVLFPGSGHLH